MSSEPYFSFLKKLAENNRLWTNFTQDVKLEENGIKFKKIPWAEQLKVIDTFMNKQGFCGMIQAPTGSGKTNIFLFLLGLINKRSLIIVPTSSLVEQTYQRVLEVIDIDKNRVGRYYSKRKELRDITISTWQSLYKKDTFEKILEFGFNVIIADEAHRTSAEKYGWILNSYPAMYKIGVTATPFHTNQENTEKMKLLLGPIVYKVDIEDLYNSGNLVRPNVAFIKTGVNINIMNIFIDRYINDMNNNPKFTEFVRYKLSCNGLESEKMELEALAYNYFFIDDFAYKCASAIDQKNYPPVETIDVTARNQALGILKSGIDNNPLRRMNIISFIVETIQKAGKSLILLNTIDNCNLYQEELAKYGIDTIVITGKSKNKGDLLKQFNDAKDAIAIGTTSLLGEGLDIPSLKNLYVCSPVYPPFNDLARVAQVPGRAVRSYEGKTEANIVYFDDMYEHKWIEFKKEAAKEIISEEFHPNYLSPDEMEMRLRGENF